MSISRLGSPQDNWVEIGTSSPTSGSVVTFSSIANYRKLRVVALNVVLSGSGIIQITFNNDTANNYSDKQAKANSNLNNGSDGSHSFDLEIDYNSQSTWKKVEGWWNALGFSEYLGFWASTNAITEIDLTLNTGTYTSGTIKLYGTN